MEQKLTRVTAYVSACAGLSFCANYSFAYANILLLVLFAGRISLEVDRWRGRARLAFAAAWPAAVLVFCITGPMLLRFPRRELWWGATSLAETWQYIYHASFDGPWRDCHMLPVLALALAAYVLLLICQRKFDGEKCSGLSDSSPLCSA
jgi:hypothetical protein